MADVIKTQYMDKATRGYSEYIARDLNALQTISPKEGDRAILLDGSLYICVDNGTWDIAGGTKETDILIITAGYKTGGERGYTIDKTYAEIYSAAQAGKTIIMIDPIAFAAAGELPIILTPYSFNSDGSGTFVTIAKGDDMGGSKDYRYSITVYPDNTVIPRWEDLSQELDHTVTFKVDGQPYTIVSVKDGQSVSAPSPNPTSASGTFTGWLNGEISVTFPYTPTGNVELQALFANSQSGLLYELYGVDKNECPYVVIHYKKWMDYIDRVYFCTNISSDGTKATINSKYIVDCISFTKGLVTEATNSQQVVDIIISVKPPISLGEGTFDVGLNSGAVDYVYANAPLNIKGEFILLT